MENTNGTGKRTVLSKTIDHLQTEWAKVKDPTPTQQLGYDLCMASVGILDVFLTKQFEIQRTGGTPIGPGPIAVRMNSVHADLLKVIATLATPPGGNPDEAFKDMVADLVDVCVERLGPNKLEAFLKNVADGDIQIIVMNDPKKNVVDL